MGGERHVLMGLLFSCALTADSNLKALRDIPVPDSLLV
jgi:hypothetical protein